jgi:hypothetical protein
MPEPITAPVSQAVAQTPDEIRAAAMNEALELQNAGARLGLEMEVREALGRGLSGDAVRKMITDKLVERGGNPFSTPAAAVQLTEKEQRSYSIARAIMAQATNTSCFEREVSQEVSKKLGREARGIYVPTTLGMKRSLDATVQATAQGLISQEPVTFIEFLYAALALRKCGATFLPGCVGNIPFARQISTPGITWTGDDPTLAVANGDQILQVFTMSPKQAMAKRQYSKQLLTQTAGFADTYVMNDLAQSHALGIDLAGLFGAGTSNQPMGVANQTGLTVVPIATNGAAPTFANTVALETAVALANVDTTNAAYLTNTKVRGQREGDRQRLRCLGHQPGPLQPHQGHRHRSLRHPVWRLARADHRGVGRPGPRDGSLHPRRPGPDPGHLHSAGGRQPAAHPELRGHPRRPVLAA